MTATLPAAPAACPPDPVRRVAGVSRIVVLRALMLGDMLCATPALRALRAAYPRAHIALVGLPAARALVQRLASVDEFIDFPGHPGLPERACDPRAVPPFLAALRARGFDLALQLHGNGAVTNALVERFGARTTAGFAAPGAPQLRAQPSRFIAWPQHGHEIERLLALTDHLGLPRQGRGLDFPLRDDDVQGLRRAWPPPRGTYVCVHPGAQLPSRRWPPQRFAAVADGLAARGHTVVLTGTRGEAGLVRAVAQAMRAACVDLAGRTSLWTLGALVAGARAVVCNDTGVSHVAAALRCPSVVVSCGGDVARWAPLEARRHAVLWHDLACRPCAYRDCPYGHGCAQALTAAQVLARFDALMADLHTDPVHRPAPAVG